MPIRLLLEHDHLFEPEEIDSLILAFENTLRCSGLPIVKIRSRWRWQNLSFNLPKTMSETLAGCERASWRRSDAQLPLQVYRSYLDGFRRSDRGSILCRRASGQPQRTDTLLLLRPGDRVGRGKGRAEVPGSLRAPLSVVGSAGTRRARRR